MIHLWNKNAIMSTDKDPNKKENRATGTPIDRREALKRMARFGATAVVAMALPAVAAAKNYNDYFGPGTRTRAKAKPGVPSPKAATPKAGKEPVRPKPVNPRPNPTPGPRPSYSSYDNVYSSYRSSGYSSYNSYHVVYTSYSR